MKEVVMMDKLTNFFKLLSDETRLKILFLLHNEALCVCEICGILNISQPKVSKHLAKMRDLGLVKVRKKEQYVYYSLNIEDDMLVNVTQCIMDNMEEYPEVLEYRSKLKFRDQYLKKCKVND